MARETAYAKINLALNVRGRRADGYHDLETVFAFVDAGDVLTARIADHDEVRTFGDFGGALGDPLGNLVAKALGHLPRADGLSITLEKNLPVAAGMGGGSADAAAIVRIIREGYGLPDDWRERAISLGADVPACIDSVTCIGRGTGTELAVLDNGLAGTPVLLVNPRVPVSTARVFAAWDGADSGPLVGETAREMALRNGNDLERVTIETLGISAISNVLEALMETQPWLARMSGSGATCFALYEEADSARTASEVIAKAHPEWWQLRGSLR